MAELDVDVIQAGTTLFVGNVQLDFQLFIRLFLAWSGETFILV